MKLLAMSLLEILLSVLARTSEVDASEAEGREVPDL